MKNFFAVLFASIVIFTGCNNSGGKAEGGPCTYETKIYPATVISIENKDSSHADILFRINDEAGNLYRDSVSWYMENKNWLTPGLIAKDSIEAGKKIQYKIDEIIAGACDPRIEKLTLEKF